MTGASSLGLLGAGVGWLVGMGTLSIPGMIPLVAAGPLMGLLKRIVLIQSKIELQIEASNN